MKITFLGTGTSHGIPVIGCNCDVCRSDNLKNNRMRSSVLVEYNDSFVLIDTTPEFRIQALRQGITRIDAVLFTHCHADHVCGFDDLRRFNEVLGRKIPCYGDEKTITDIKRMFEYVFVDTQIGGGKPKVDLFTVNTVFDLFGEKIVPIKVFHGKLPVLGYKIQNFAYITDCSYIPEESLELLQNLDVLVLGALRIRLHPTHFNILEALDLVRKLRPKKTFFTHICHDLEHEGINSLLPSNVRLAYDGLVVYMNGD